MIEKLNFESPWKVNVELTCLSWNFMQYLQVIRRNLQKYVSTSCSLLQSKTLLAYFSNNMLVYCLLNIM